MCVNTNLQMHRRKLFIRAGACEVVAKLLKRPQYRAHAGIQEEAIAISANESLFCLFCVLCFVFFVFVFVFGQAP